MRTIKFRGKGKRDGKWYFGNLYDKDIYGRTHICTIEVGCLDIDTNTVCQYTGLYDKNRNEIYEGDILSIVRGHITFTAIVKWNEKEASFGLIINGSDEINKTPLGSWLLFGQCEIIGNIYDKEQ